jgi:oxaloacetate decarboxylase alpha subunit
LQSRGTGAIQDRTGLTITLEMISMDNKPIRICDTILRDAHQSLLATRMRTDDMLPIAEKLDQVGYWSVEMWGGATFDSAMRFLNEDPWERIRKLKARMPNTPFQMLLRGQNVVGYKHYPDDVLERFIVKAHENGIHVFRIFDALNDVRNMQKATQVVKREGAHAQGAICYTISPVHNVAAICVKDMAGLLSPYVAYELVGRLKDEIQVPIQLHTHYTSGMAMAAVLKAVEAGVDIVDTAISSLAMVTSQPPTETLVRILQESSRDTGLDLGLLAEISHYFAEVRKKYAAFESGMKGVDVNVLQFQIPGGMLSNLVSQLREQGAEDRYAEVLAEVPRVREEMGFPPLVTPSSQIVGTQATLNVVLGERYKVIPAEVKNYVRGYYGQPPAPIDPEIKKKAIGDEEPIDCRPADLILPGMEQARAEIGDLAQSEEDVISYALFPQVARPFLERRENGGGAKEALVAAIAALVMQQHECRPAALATKAGLSISPWKTAWRPQSGRWAGLIDGAGGAR